MTLFAAVADDQTPFADMLARFYGGGSDPATLRLVELQYNTRAQHAWATAVEISDLVDGERTKFEFDASERGRFLQSPVR